ncbi:relaxase/mobilization nuclease domain-containing protein [Limosilactobacillus reuteri]|uniref:Putative mobilization protein MobA n=2 Tax=Limosilactobacillus fermentum TaxID=1613 RepID=Q84EV8_LIMFE|nr:relaxase/mobilization nuclease domain-containing protein [Limosilactobacillus reuteri]CAD59910.1 putative mobilization protein MobA [Limosilactobacillus fermentum]
MATLMSNACRSSYGRLTYVFNQSAHNTTKTSHRVLASSGINIKMLHNPDGTLSLVQSGAYLEKQFHNSLKRAFNPKRKIQCQSIIISFSNNEFDTTNLSEQASQALQLVQGYANEFFDDAQSVSVVQADGNGGRLHVHLLINAVNPSGRTIATNRFSVYKMRRNLNDYLNHNFERVTGRKWENPFEKTENRKDLDNLSSRSIWQEQLKKTIALVKTEVDNVKDFLNKLSQLGITVTERQQGKSWTYHSTIKTAKGTKKVSARDFYQRIDKNTGQVLTTRGLGQAYTKQSLEAYYQRMLSKQKEILPLETPPHHTRKEVDNNVRNKEEREQLAKIKTRAAEARAQITRQREINQLNLRQLAAAKAEEQRQQQQAERKAGQAHRQQSHGKHAQSIIDQERLRKRAEQRLRAKQQNAKSSRSKDAGPDL